MFDAPDRTGPDIATMALTMLADLAPVSPILLCRPRDAPVGWVSAAFAEPVFLPPHDAVSRCASLLAPGAQPPLYLPALAEVASFHEPRSARPPLTEPAALLRHVMNRRRLERLLARLHRLRPGLIVLNGAALAPLAPALHSLGCPLVWVVPRRESAHQRALAGEENPPHGAEWHAAAAQAFDAAERMAAPHIDQLWLPSPEASAAFADLIPPARRVVLPQPSPDAAPTLHAAIAAALLPLGIVLRPRPPDPFAVLTERESIRFNPVTRLLEWSFDLRGATGATLRLTAADGRVLDHGYVLLHPGRGRTTRVEAMTVLPRDVAPDGITMDITLPAGPIYRHPAPLPLEERAGLLALTPSRGRFELLAWSLDDDALLQPEPVEQDSTGASRLLRAQIDLPPDTPVVSVTPARGAGQTLHRPSVWTRPRPPSSLRLRDLAGRHSGEVAWIVGNGPSVRTEDLDALAGRLTFCFNRFHLAHASTRLRPTYTVTGDRQMIADFGEDIVNLSGGTVFVADQTPPAIAGDYIWVRQLPVFPPLFSLTPEVAVTPGGSSLYVALQLAHGMGVRRFFLYGTDFTYRFAQNDSPDPFRSAVGEGHHFIPGYRSGRAWCPPALRDITAGFLAARRVIESGGGFIRNASRGGLLEIFDRQPFETALALR